MKGPKSEGCMVDLEIGLTPKMSETHHFAAFLSVVADERVGGCWRGKSNDTMGKIRASISSINNRLV